jgi:hypothetical protein
MQLNRSYKVANGAFGGIFFTWRIMRAGHLGVRTEHALVFGRVMVMQGRMHQWHPKGDEKHRHQRRQTAQMSPRASSQHYRLWCLVAISPTCPPKFDGARKHGMAEKLGRIWLPDRHIRHSGTKNNDIAFCNSVPFAIASITDPSQTILITGHPIGPDTQRDKWYRWYRLRTAARRHGPRRCRRVWLERRFRPR